MSVFSFSRWASCLAIGTLLTVAPRTSAMENMQPNPQRALQPIEQPSSRKVIITLGGLGLIGTELWWFLRKPHQVQQATKSTTGIQTQTIIVDGGYQPDQIVVQAGQPVKLHFQRQDANSCLEEVLLPDFGIQQQLPLNQTTSIEFTPQAPGEYAFTCGMRMFRGSIKVEANTDRTKPCDRVTR